ncbi:MAG: DUF4291 family protein [Myxococcales bacterium]|nr:DUF4291 family protein [Myxococcales bacterium]
MRWIRAMFDVEGVYVYQAFKDNIVQEALRLGHFGKGFGLERMTWIKPSFGWILHRSGYATKHRQTRIVRVKIPHEHFLGLLQQAVSTSYDRDAYPSQSAWQLALDRSEVLVQWDPERDIWSRPTGERAIQLGIRGDSIKHYALDWPLSVEDVTPWAHRLRQSIDGGVMWEDAAMAAIEAEILDDPLGYRPQNYPIPAEIAERLGCKANLPQS